MFDPSRIARGILVAAGLVAAMLPTASASAQEKKAATPAAPAPAAPGAQNGVWLYLADADGSNMKLLADLPAFPYQGSPSWSRNGKLIAFDVQKPQKGEGSQHSRIVVVNADGANARLLGDGAMPSLSPEGKRIAFSRYFPNNGVWVMSAEGPDTELVLLDERGWGTDWSPDGKKIAYAVSTESGANLVVFDLVEGDRRSLFPEASPYAAVHWNFSWSPDSQRIAFRGKSREGKEEVAIVDARGSSHGLTTRLTNVSWNWLAWSPDGSKILTTLSAAKKAPQIVSFKPEGNDPPQPLAGQNAEAGNVNAAWSPDGKKLALCSRLAPPQKAAAPGGALPTAKGP
jgi:TolB protein